MVVSSLSDPVDTLLRHCEERLRRINPDCVCGATLDCFAVARNDDPVGRVTPSLRGALATKQPRLRLRSKLWIASLSLAMTILVRTQASLPRTFPVSRRPQRDGKRRTVPAGP